MESVDISIKIEINSGTTFNLEEFLTGFASNRSFGRDLNCATDDLYVTALGRHCHFKEEI